MLKILAAFALSAALLLPVVPSSEAAGYCPSRPGGKCPEKRSANGKSRSEFTPEQRKQILESARKLCVRTYGASSRVYSYDWKKRQVTCNTPGQ
jgi:hypothetical protein